MAIDIVHVSDIHFGSGESHGRVNPASGLNTRFEDFVAALAKVVDYTIDNQCDVFLFSGDAYRNASPEPVYQKMFARELKRLSDAQVKTLLLVGNHDQILRSNSSHSMSVFQSLSVPGVTIIDRPVSTRIETKNGSFQLIGLPHVTRHQIVTADQYLSLPASLLERIINERIETVLKGFYEELDGLTPVVVTAHMTVDRALAGIEKELLIGYTLTFPTDIFIDDRLDYVALGHVHKHQIIRQEKPAIVYAGSLERVDFGEEDEDKGFIHVKLARGKTTWQFHSIAPRPFVTIDCDATGLEDVTEHLCRLIKKRVKPGCVLRIRCRLKQDQISRLDEKTVRAAASTASLVRLQPEVVANAGRSRLPQLSETAVSTPLDALELYLNQVAPQRKEHLLKRASELIDQLRGDD